MVKVAHFIGRDGSMGLRHGQYYEITIYGNRKKILYLWNGLGMTVSYGSVRMEVSKLLYRIGRFKSLI